MSSLSFRFQQMSLEKKLKSQLLHEIDVSLLTIDCFLFYKK
jgi:hypothetical protein